MKKAIWTEAVAERFGHPELVGEIVEYGDHPEGHPFHGIQARWVYYQDERLGGSVTIGEPDGLEPVEDER